MFTFFDRHTFAKLHGFTKLHGLHSFSYTGHCSGYQSDEPTVLSQLYATRMYWILGTHIKTCKVVLKIEKQIVLNSKRFKFTTWIKSNTNVYQLFDWYLLFCVVLYVQAPYSHYSSSSRAEMKKKEWSETFHVFVQLTIYVHNFAFKYNIQLNNINQLFN